MIQPVDLEDFFIAFFSAAMVLVSGALYALLFAYAKVHARPRLMPYAYGAYALLVVSVVLLARAMHWSGLWILVAVLMVAGYLLAPHIIYRLSVATHASEHEYEGARATGREGAGPR
jgi:hypothetical protein